MRNAEWYFDEDTIGVAKVLAAAKLPVTWPGDDGKRSSPRLIQEPSPIATSGRAGRGVDSRCGNSGLPIITRDHMILARTNEVNAVVASRARMFVITSRAPLSLWDQVRVVAAQWTHMRVRCLDEGPFIDGITFSGVRRLYPGRV